ncbi:MAG TPA: serine/threonine-protein kinase, partial [Woeseiaceae bacterium]|nr:serine/threonine-protein kinase [Woeseiaceae bacterium]
MPDSSPAPPPLRPDSGQDAALPADPDDTLRRRDHLHPRLSRDRSGISAGDVLCGRYAVMERVAHHGMGVVYKALDRHRESAGAPAPWVALKFARNPPGDGGEASTFLRREFLKLSELHHPNIVSVFDIARDGDVEFLVLEWLSGETLEDLLARITTKRIALDRATEIVRSTARALAHAHDLGIVHGDVKPSNIFLTQNRTVKLLDFGSSAASGGEAERNWATRAYASGDILRGRPPQPHDDVFSLGVTAYCLFSGERPFGDLDAMAAEEQGVRPKPLPHDAREKWPAVRHTLVFRAIDRPGNAGFFLQELEEPPSDDPPRRAAPRSPTVAYGALATTLLASVVWWSVQSIGGLPDDVAAALANADSALAAGRLVQPEGESAWSWYSAALKAEPGNRQASDGLEEVAERLLVRARGEIESNDIAGARASLALARKVSPGYFGAPLVEELIESRGRDALMRSSRVAETDIDRAEALLSEAEALLPADDPELARTREALAARQAEHQVGELLQEIDARILSERLTVPSGDSAL